MRAANSSGTPSDGGWREGRQSRPVYERRRLRVDGHPPFRDDMSEILVVRVGGPPVAETVSAAGEAGTETLSIMLTADGHCVAHFAAEPPVGAPARPTYRLARIEVGADVSALVREGHRDLEAVMTTNIGPDSAKAHEHPVQLLKQTSATMEKTIAPYVASL